MTFAFFYPLAWLGALALAAPIWLHLRRRNESDVVRFAAMRFLDDQPPARRRPLWPTNWPLLLLRLLALLLLVAAFSWPYLRTHQETVIAESRVYILDNTLSHQAENGFQKARDEIVRARAAAGLETQIAVVQLAAEPDVLVGFDADRETALTKLRALQPSYQRGSYLAAFRQASRLLRQSLGTQKHIVLLGDSQENQWQEGQQIAPFLAGVQVTLPDVKELLRPNLALTQPRVRRLLAGNQSTVECSVTLVHQGDFKTATLVWHVNGKDALRRTIELAGQPESLSLAAQWEAKPDEWLHGKVRLQGTTDSLPADDRVVFALPPVREGRVLLLAQSPYLRTALAPEIMRGRWLARLPKPSAPLARAERDQGVDDVLCVESHFLQTPDARRLVLDFLGTGRGVLLVVDDTTPAITGFLHQLGIEVLPAVEKQVLATRFRYVFLQQEIFRPFRSADFGNLADIQVTHYQRLQMPQATPLIFSESGDPLLLDAEHTGGRLLVLAFALDRPATNWPLHPTFVPFLDRCLQYIRSEPTRRSSFQPGETCLWRIPAGHDVKQVVLKESGPKESGSADRGLLAKAPVRSGQARLRLPAKPGLYTLYYDEGSTIEGVLAVNPPPKESHLQYSKAPAVLEAWQGTAAAPQTAAAPAALLALATPEILRQRVWWWLLAAGLTLLVAESLWVCTKRGVP